MFGTAILAVPGKMKNVQFNVICIGAGGTGGNFAKEFARYASMLDPSKYDISFSLVDGDYIEESNISRQPYMLDDISKNKAVTLVEAIQDVFNFEKIFAYPEYISSKEDVINIINSNFDFAFYNKKRVVVLVGCVDNHATRIILEEVFFSRDNIIYIDSANEYSVGEICIAVKLNGQTMAPPRSFYFPEILTADSPSPAMSCSALNTSSPQHIATNLMAAHLLLSIVSNVISNGKVQGGVLYFDAFKYFSRFIPFEEIKAAAERKDGVVKNEKSNI